MTLDSSLLICYDAIIIGFALISDIMILCLSFLARILPCQYNIQSLFNKYDDWCGSHIFGVRRNTSSRAFSVSTLGFDVGKYENNPQKDNGILTFSSGEYIEWYSTDGSSTCISGVSLRTIPVSLIMNGGIILFVIDSRCYSFWITNIYVVLSYGQSYCTTESTILIVIGAWSGVNHLLLPSSPYITVCRHYSLLLPCSCAYIISSCSQIHHHLSVMLMLFQYWALFHQSYVVNP